MRAVDAAATGFARSSGPSVARAAKKGASVPPCTALATGSAGTSGTDQYGCATWCADAARPAGAAVTPKGKESCAAAAPAGGTR